ncbi:MAG: contractile injection system tape measure protein [Prolixibacteraceae bacterium]
MATHLIHRINLTVEVPDERMAGPIQQNAVELLYHDILPRLEKVLDELSFSADRVSIDEVNLDAGRLNSNEFDALFPVSVEKSLRAEMSLAGRPETKMPGSGPAPEKGAGSEGSVDAGISIGAETLKGEAVAPGNGVRTARPPVQPAAENGIRTVRSPEQALAESFLYFLETGSLPWWCRAGEAPDESRLTVLLASDKKLLLTNEEEFCIALLRLLMINPVAARRLTFQFPAAFVRELFSALMNPLSCLSDAQTEEAPAQTKEGAVSDEDTEVSASLPDFGSFTFRLLRQMETGSDGPDHFAATQWQEGVSPASKNLPHVPLKPSVPEQIVDHAGLILLHPFLESLFSEFGLLEEGKLKDQACRARAVHLLAYLATGQENLPEFALQFEKYLCGMKPDEPLPRFVQLSSEMKTEAKTLLKAAIGHWKILKSTSPEGLSEGFLVRKGKLVTAGLQHRLIVEQRSHDLLLAYLPWGISMVKLRWLDQLLTVDWNP